MKTDKRHFFKTDFLQLGGREEEKQNPTKLLMLFSHVCDAAVCIFVPVLEIKGDVTLRVRPSQRQTFLFPAKARLCYQHTDEFNH